MTNKEIQNLVKKLEWYAKFFKETSISNTLTEQERIERVVKSETYADIVEIIKHDLGIQNGKRSA